MKPMIIARFFQEMKLLGGESVLHIGSNFGYGSAVLSKLCSAVISLEGDKKLFDKSSETFLSLAAHIIERCPKDLGPISAPAIKVQIYSFPIISLEM